MKVWDIAILVLLFIVLFGPSKLPDLAKNMGHALNEFKKAANPDSNNNQNSSSNQQQSATRPTKARRKRAVKAAK